MREGTESKRPAGREAMAFRRALRRLQDGHPLMDRVGKGKPVIQVCQEIPLNIAATGRAACPTCQHDIGAHSIFHACEVCMRRVSAQWHPHGNKRNR